MQLRARVAGFPGFLRTNGYEIGAADSVSTIEAAQHTGILDKCVLRWNLRTLLCNRREEWRRFDALFDAYFLQPNKQVVVQGFSDTGLPDTVGDEFSVGDGTVANAAARSVSDSSPEARHGASREESLGSTDFRELYQAEEAQAIELLMRRLAKRLKHLLVRREARSHRGRRIDARATIRQSVASGGTPVRLAWRAKRRVRPRIVLLLDVSRSMSAYSFFYLRAARALCNELADVHCFIFHTRLTGVSEALRDPDPWRAQERLHVIAVGWAGGTRIGECLQDFNRNLASRLVHSRTGVVVVSDGYDTGEPEQLAQAMAALRRRARRIVWFNPLLNLPSYVPVAGGMQAAMPYIDLLASGADLKALESELSRLIEALQ